MVEDTAPNDVVRALSDVVVVLVEPQDDINIGNAIRACKNFGIVELRLVNPASADPARIAISAPRADDVIASMRRFETVDEALADCVFVAGMTARRRRASWTVTEPRGAAAAAAEAASRGRVALVFGREDSGLPNAVLDRCTVVVTVPTNPDYSSINLGQAVLLMAWEMFRVMTDQPIDRLEHGVSTTATPRATGRAGRGKYEPADLGRLEYMFARAEEALEAIEFFKSGNNAHIMRAVRAVFLRAGLDRREAALWHGIFTEIIAYMARTGRKKVE